MSSIGLQSILTAENQPLVGTSQIQTVPAPIGGLNARDAVANMPPTDAVVMENWFPKTSSVSLRSGSANWVTGLPGWVESLMAYGNASGRKLFAASGTAFYDATSAGAVGAAVVSGLTNARWEACNMGTPGGQYLIACNAVDKPQLYDGSTWQAVDSGSSPIAITGVTTTKLRCPTVWKNRIFFIEDASFNVWYLPTQSIGGAASKIPLGSLFKLGGQLQAIVTVTIDSASEIDDYMGFVSTEGELVLYRGSDPAQAGLFNLVGVFRTGRPVGRRCAFKSGADTILLTSDGYVPVSKLLMYGQSSAQTTSFKIEPLVNGDYSLYSGNFGWQGIVFPAGNKVLINVPEGQTQRNAHQWVMNTITQAWTKFTGWNAACLEVMGDQLFFGGNTVVMQADTGSSDNGANIFAKLKPAFSYFGTAWRKVFHMVRPIFFTTGTVGAAVTLNTDFSDIAPTQAPSAIGGAQSPWNTSPWNTSPWSVGQQIQNSWIDAPGEGFAASLYMTVATNKLTIDLYSFDWLFEVGGAP